MTVEEGVEIGRRIAADAVPRRIFCTNDQLALATEGATLITSVAQPKVEMGREAVRLVMSELRDGDDHRHTAKVFAPLLVVRESAPPA